ncbi:hypothetical protein PoB_004781600 [Plakobranchus ocellatus]|uniref:Uncharacterized protein n=1 Tax=Plakobranchus ocellatus TaxID=259542 RepID=A0AAV4BD81_9GAST|nr:hypothetical protein PoB_004781600 [Plakobranchus ocellatus]
MRTNQEAKKRRPSRGEYVDKKRNQETTSFKRIICGQNKKPRSDVLQENNMLAKQVAKKQCPSRGEYVDKTRSQEATFFKRRICGQNKKPRSNVLQENNMLTK